MGEEMEEEDDDDAEKSAPLFKSRGFVTNVRVKCTECVTYTSNAVYTNFDSIPRIIKLFIFP